MPATATPTTTVNLDSRHLKTLFAASSNGIHVRIADGILSLTTSSKSFIYQIRHRCPLPDQEGIINPDDLRHLRVGDGFYAFDFAESDTTLNINIGCGSIPSWHEFLAKDISGSEILTGRILPTEPLVTAGPLLKSTSCCVIKHSTSPKSHLFRIDAWNRTYEAPDDQFVLTIVGCYQAVETR